VQISLPGPWTLVTALSLPSGARVLGDSGARRDVVQAYAFGISDLAERIRRLGPDVVIRFAELAEEHHGHLTRLDQVTGDGDFGDNLRGGLRHATRLMEEADAAGFAAAERAFLNGVGGTSGPLLGLLFQE
ncbi:DAK2 domain-containing protein, partial [Mycobacterium tuberculosis]|nr:DAK2 domain-containing protein [Mycobacterium tuberculosis]